MLVCNYFFFSVLLRFLFYGTRRGVNGALFGALGVLVGVVLFYIGVVLFSSGRQNGDMWHRYGAVLQQIAVMKQ